LAVPLAAGPILLEATEIINKPYDESQERWGDLRGRHAVDSRLHEMETRLKQMREELAEIGRWAGAGRLASRSFSRSPLLPVFVE
jgi:hypothetical protein